jgi:hypothetical protein
MQVAGLKLEARPFSNHILKQTSLILSLAASGGPALAWKNGICNMAVRSADKTFRSKQTEAVWCIN